MRHKVHVCHHVMLGQTATKTSLTVGQSMAKTFEPLYRQVVARNVTVEGTFRSSEVTFDLLTLLLCRSVPYTCTCIWTVLQIHIINGHSKLKLPYTYD